MIALDLFKHRSVAVFGLGRTGLAAARALKAGGARALLWDDAPERRQAAQAEGFELAQPSSPDWAGAAALVLSPGVPFDPKPHAVVDRARQAGIEIVGDIELLQRAQPQACFVGVTGTNGKSTTTALIGHILERYAMTVAVGGNIGRPALDLPALGAGGIYVLELSSYQLDLAQALAFDIGVLLNVTPDHLDRHGSIERYSAAKRRILQPRDAASIAVVATDDAVSQRFYDEIEAEPGRNVVEVSTRRPLANGIYVAEGVLHDAVDGVRSAVADLRLARALPGRHNWQNAACAFAVARVLGVPSACAGGAILSFPGLAHRIETVATVQGVCFVNDSKATNADAAAKALACFDRVYWIGGGRPKPGGIDALEPFFPRIAHAFLIGEAAPAFAHALEGRLPVTRSGTLERAVNEAFACARAEAAAAGSAVVLLSPACASFDQFTDFEARGESFRALARALANGGKGHNPAPQRAAS